MLTQPLTTQVPVASIIFTQYCSLMSALYRWSDTENARGLISWFDHALATVMAYRRCISAQLLRVLGFPGFQAP